MEENKKQKSLLLEDVKWLAVKILLIGAILAVVLLVLVGICRSSDDSMSPAIREGDLVIYDRLSKEFRSGDVVVLKQEKGNQIRRVAAVAGDVVDLTDEGLLINGYLQQEAHIYTETLPYEEGIRFPLTVGENQIFLLGDDRGTAEDGRIYGATDLEQVCGLVTVVIRKNGL